MGIQYVGTVTISPSRVFFGVRKSFGLTFNYLILWSMVKVKLLGSVNSNHNPKPKLHTSP